MLFPTFTFLASLAIGAASHDGSRYVKRYTVEHVTIPCSRTFAEARAALEASIPLINTTYSALLQAGDVAGALAALNALPTLNSFISPARDFGRLLEVKDITGKLAVQYEIGNPLIAVTMAQYHLPVVLYAPVRVVLSELAADDLYPCGFSFDTPTSTFGNLADGSKQVLEVAEYLEGQLRAHLASACGWSRDGEWSS